MSQGGVTDAADGDIGDDDLLRGIAGGDRRAFQRLMARHGKAMMVLAERTTGSADDADELVQEAFLKVWTMAPRWTPDGAAQFSTWLYRVVLNASLDRRRRRPVLPLEAAGDPADGRPGGLDLAMAGQRHRVVVAAMAELSARQREALSLHYFAELSAPEAARVLDLSLSATEALLFRAKRALKAALVRRGVTGLGDVT